MEIGSYKHLLLLFLRQNGETCDIGIPAMSVHIERCIDTTRKYLRELARDGYVSIVRVDGKPSVIKITKKGMNHE